MSGNFLKIVKTEPKETGLLLLMSVQAILVGLFIGGFDLSMHALFLKYFGASEIKNVYVFSGISGIILMFFYTWFSTRIRFRFFIFFNYFLVFSLSLFIFYFIYFDFYKEVVYTGFALMFPLNIMTFLNFQRSQREIFRPVQTKRLTIILQAAFYAGIVAASYGSILFMFFSSEISFILGISTACLLFVILFQMLINVIHRFSPVFLHSPKKLNPIRSRFIELFYSKYTVWLMLFVLLSSIVGYLLHYNFIYSTRLNYPSIVGFTKFLGLFTGTLFLFTFLVDKILIRKLLYSYDSPYSLFLIPVVLVLFLIMSVGIFYVFGTGRLIARFSFFFLIVAMIKVVYELSKYDVEMPSFRVLFKTLDIRFHGTIIPRIDGTVRLAGILFTGFILGGILNLKFIKIIHLNILTLIFSVFWLIVAIYLVRSYQSALLGNIKKLRTVKKGNELLKAADEKLHRLINHPSPEKIIRSLHISEKVEPVSFEKHILNLIKENDEQLKKFVFKKIEENDLLFAYPYLKELPGENSSNITGINLARRFEQKISLGNTEDRIERLASSKNVNDRVLAADLIGYLNKRELSTILINLSRDFEPEVKIASVRAMARGAFPETCHTLIGFLNSPVFYPYAFEALVKTGDDSLEHLERLFDLPDSDDRLLSRVVKVYGKIATPSAIECLLSKIENQNRFISRQAIRALREARFQATPGNINRILNIIVRTINTMSWNFSALSTLEKSGLDMLKDAIEGELEDNYRILYNLMALAYNSNSVTNIQSLIDEGSDTDISFAIEMLDHIVLDEVKQVLFPVVENLSVKARVKQLQYFFQNENYSVSEIIPAIIVRDFNHISIYTKTCAIFNWQKISNKISDILVANLFHPNKLIRETSAYVIQKMNSGFLETVYPRLPVQYAWDIKTSLEHTGSKTDFLVFEKVEYLKKRTLFSEVPEEILYEIAINLKVRKMFSGQVSPAHKDQPLFLVYEGNIEVMTELDEIIHVKKNEVFYSGIYFEDAGLNYKIKALNETILFALEKNILDMLMFDYSEFRVILLELIETGLK